MDRFAFADTRYLNALIDYEDWQRNRSLVMRSHLLPGNAWPNAQATNRGYFSLQDGETDTFTYVLTDRKATAAASRLHSRETPGSPYPTETGFLPGLPQGQRLQRSRH
jgi:hypothetical protein